MNWICPMCGHSVLNHKKGQCLVIVTMPLPKGLHGEVAKRHCGCDHIRPHQALQLTFKGTAVDIDRL